MITGTIDAVLKLRLVSPEESVLTAAADVIRAGGVLVYPTETLYGIGADALNPSAIAKVIAAKKRNESKPILILAHSIPMVRTLVAEIQHSAYSFMEGFWPGPLTIVFKAARNIPAEITQGSGTIGIRIPSSKFCIELLKRCGCPLTSTSANISGEPVHRTIEEIHRALTAGIDLYIDAGSLPESKPSTVISVVNHPPKLIREGVISFETLQTVVPQTIR